MSDARSVSATVLEMGPPSDDVEEAHDPVTGDLLVDVRLRMTVEDARALAPFLYEVVRLKIGAAQ